MTDKPPPKPTPPPQSPEPGPGFFPPNQDVSTKGKPPQGEKRGK